MVEITIGHPVDFPPAIIVVATSHTSAVLVRVPVVEVLDLVRVFQLGCGGQIGGQAQVLMVCQWC